MNNDPLKPARDNCGQFNYLVASGDPPSCCGYYVKAVLAIIAFCILTAWISDAGIRGLVWLALLLGGGGIVVIATVVRSWTGRSATEIAHDKQECGLYVYLNSETERSRFASPLRMTFEPVIVQFQHAFVPQGVLDRPRLRRVIWSALVLGPVISFQFTNHWASFSPLAVVALLTLLAALRPEYLRISPGRIDVMVTWSWSSNVRLYHSYDLQRTCCIARLDRGYIVLDDAIHRVLINAAVLRDDLEQVTMSIRRAYASMEWRYDCLSASDLLG